MSCDLAGYLMDDYLEDDLSDHDRQRLEKHLKSCSRCAGELDDRLVFERRLRQALVASVQHVQLKPEASRRILQAIEPGGPRPAWSDSAGPLFRLIPAMIVVALMLAGLVLLFGQFPVPSKVERVVLSPASRPAAALDLGGLVVEPKRIQAGDLFTVTVPIDGGLFRDTDMIRGNLDINGPTGRYHFAFDLPGPWPAVGPSVFMVTPGVLVAPCQEQYQISPGDILRAPGVYKFRVTIFGPATTSAP